MANVYDDDQETLRFADEGDYLDERYLIDRAEHEAHAEGNAEEPDEPEWNDCGHDRAKRDDIECPECGADLAALDDE